MTSPFFLPPYELTQRVRGTLLSLLLLCFALSPVRAAATASSEIAITHITVVDVKAGTSKPDMTVLIQGNRITAVRPSKDKESPPTKEIQVINGRGKFLVPGFWDVHVHPDGEDRMLCLLLANGIVGIRDMGGNIMKVADAKRRIASGELIAPRLLFAGPLLEGQSEEGDE